MYEFKFDSGLNSGVFAFMIACLFLKIIFAKAINGVARAIASSFIAKLNVIICATEYVIPYSAAKVKTTVSINWLNDVVIPERSTKNLLLNSFCKNPKIINRTGLRYQIGDN